jgi:hypothetical protein
MEESDILMNKIRDYSKTNLDLIDRIQAQGTEEQITRTSYDISLVENKTGVPEYKVVEVEEECNRIEIIKSWRKRIDLKRPIDLFNDNLEYRCDSFDDVVRLNDSMSRVMEKYTFLDSKRAAAELQKFKDNFEILYASLIEFDQFFHVKQESKLGQYKAEIEEINKRFCILYSNPDLHVKKIDSWREPCTSHAVIGRIAKQIQSQTGCLISKNGYNTGVRKWKLRIITRPSTCMVGVAPDTVKSGTLNYNSCGFYMNLNGGALYSGPPMNKSGAAGFKNIEGGKILIVTLNCTNRTLTYTYEGTDFVAYTDLPMDKKLHLAWDNDTTAGSEIEIIS